MTPYLYMNAHYSNIYSINMNVEGSPKNKKIDSYVCFGVFLHTLYKAIEDYGVEEVSDVKLNMFIRMSPLTNVTTGVFRNNNCYLNNEDLMYFLNYVNKFIIPFSYKVMPATEAEMAPGNFIDSNYNIEDFVKIEVAVDPTKSRQYNLFLLSMLRYLFEFPFNVALYDAIKIKKAKLAASLNLFELAFALTTVSDAMLATSQGQYFTDVKNPAVIPLNILKKALVTKKSVNDIFEYTADFCEVNSPYIYKYATRCITFGESKKREDALRKYYMYYDSVKLNLEDSVVFGIVFKEDWETRYTVMYKDILQSLISHKRHLKNK